MRYTKLLAWAVMAVGVMVAGTQANAEEPYGRGRDLRGDYRNVNSLRNDIAMRRARLDEDLRCGRRSAAAEERRAIARDEAAINAQYRDIQHDRNRW